MDITQVQRLYRFHPAIGMDANDIDIGNMTADQRAKLAEMIRNGAKFYWDKTDETGVGVVAGYVRVERSNIEFVLKALGAKYEFLETAPAQPGKG